jgi:hypothetical protein
VTASCDRFSSQQKPATDLPARAFGSGDDDHVPVICPTSHFFSRFELAK